MSVHQVLAYGPIAGHDEKLGVLVTVNGAYLNLWVGREDRFENTDCRHLASRTGGRDLHELTVSEAMDLATEWIGELCGEGM